MKEALLYEKLDNKSVQCRLCAHYCKITEQKFGLCGVRQNIGGVLYTHVYGKPIALNIDPIEKKPLYHFFPGSTSFSVATIGCNFHCGFCQNWDISQSRVRDAAEDLGKEKVSPEEIVKGALKYKCKSISYTYTEPTIFFEYAFETAKLAKEKGLYNNFVTNGYMSKGVLLMIKPYLDAANVDLKFFKDSSYKKVCSGSLQPVLDSIRLMYELGIWIEVTTLVVPAENDSEEELGGIAKFVASINKNIPWHISRFHPDYKFTDHLATPIETLKKAEEIGKSCGLNYVYVGNVIGFGNDTHCHNCKRLLIKREVFSILEYNMEFGKCTFCNAVIPGIFITN
jgi:pyruvate formate lyase activating enzyme